MKGAGEMPRDGVQLRVARKLAILLWRQAVKPGLASVHDQRVAARGDDIACERIERHFRILLVDADATLHRDRNAHRPLHGVDASGDQFLAEISEEMQKFERPIRGKTRLRGDHAQSKTWSAMAIQPEPTAL